MISLKVEPRTYNLGESIIQRGEIGREMFFIISGMVEILSDDNLHVLARFHDGQFFGEIAVLLDVPRIANVKAVSDVEVFVLTKDNLEAVFEAVPGAAEIITAEGNRQYKNWIIRNSRQHLSDQEMNGEEVEEQDFDNESLNIPRSLSVPTIEQSASLMEDEATSPSVRSFDQDSMHSISPRPIHPIEAGHPSAISVLPMTPTDDFSLGHRITASPLVASPAEPAIENFDGPSATEGTSTILEEPVFDQDVSIAPTTENVLDSPTIRNPTIRGLKESNPKRRRASVAVWTQQDLLKLAEAAGAKSQVDTSHSPATSSAIARLSRAMADTTGGQTPTSPHKLSQESRGSSDVSVQMKMAPKKLTGPATFQDLDECIVVQILDNLALDQLLKARRVCRGWNSLILENSGILRDLDLSKYKKFVTDSVLADLCNTVLKSNRTRTTRVSLRDCFLVSDKGLSMLAAHIPAVQDLDLHSCWNVSDAGFRSLGVYCPQLRSIDFSNCRKLGDETIYGLYPKEAMTESSSLQKQHVVENVLGSQAEDHPVLKDAAALHSATAPADTSMDEAQALLKRRPSIEIGSDLDEQTEQLDATSSSPSPMDVDPATIPQQSQNAPHGKTLDVGAPSSGPKGCPYLARLNLSYCKNLTDKSFIHLSLYGSKQLEYLNLQRCTTISSEAFVSLDPSRKNMVFQNQLKDSNGSVHEGYNPLVDPCFPNLRELHLSDCTFLTDEAIVALAPNMPHLQVASLSFCCALTDVAVEALSENCLFLKRLDLSFCGSAVSDASLYKLARFDASEPGKHSLEELEIRGCVRVTERGVREVLSGCVNLKRLNVSSCSGIGTGELQEQGKQGDAAPPSNQTETVEQTNGWVPLQAGHSSELTRKMNALKKGKEWALAQQRPGLVIVV
ncbi:hypothetical protein BX616_004689 [Lobosporangium transversale]|nr:hypothetical protein BX616_004689 [Lobosporangium transversale]